MYDLRNAIKIILSRPTVGYERATTLKFVEVGRIKL